MQFLLDVQQIVEYEYENHASIHGRDVIISLVDSMDAAIELYKAGKRQAAKWIAQAVYCSIRGESMTEYKRFSLPL